MTLTLGISGTDSICASGSSLYGVEWDLRGGGPPPGGRGGGNAGWARLPFTIGAEEAADDP